MNLHSGEIQEISTEKLKELMIEFICFEERENCEKLKFFHFMNLIN